MLAYCSAMSCDQAGLRGVIIHDMAFLHTRSGFCRNIQKRRRQLAMLRLLRGAFLMASIAAGVAVSKEQVAADQLVFAGQGDSADIKSFEKPALSDLLTIEPSVSVFYDYVRQSETLVR